MAANTSGKPRSQWTAATVGESWVIPDWQMTRADVCTSANKAKNRSGRVFRCTAVPGGTRVERVA